MKEGLRDGNLCILLSARVGWSAFGKEKELSGMKIWINYYSPTRRL
jgi:hypothetical protein